MKRHTETNTHNFCFENKLITGDYGRITIKIPYMIWEFFVAAQSYYNCQKKFANIEDKHLKIECSAMENIFVD